MSKKQSFSSNPTQSLEDLKVFSMPINLLIFWLGFLSLSIGIGQLIFTDYILIHLIYNIISLIWSVLILSIY